MSGGADRTDWPEVTVVVPTRGRPELVRLAVQGVVAQDYAGRIHCIVVHDQEAVDDSLAGLGTPTRSVQVLLNDGAPGLAGSRNSGLRRASTPIVASCDDDDVWAPEKVRLQVERLRSEPDLSVVGAGIRLSMPGGRVVEWLGASEHVTREDLVRSRRKELHSSTLLMRREIFERVGVYDEDLPQGYAEDYDWLLRASVAGPIGVVRAPLATIRKEGTSWFRERSEVTAAALEHLLDAHPELRTVRRGHARILGQIAFAHASLGDRRTALRWSGRALLRWPLAPQALMALVQVVLRVDPRRFLRFARLAGRGLA